ncbi:uncharacterized protein V1518DRAFT_419526 [Limtongia smithiae]|uniref:uncharacterized protein n=1 Tax=Limtongia smithiae TaxID=1125753 RepID=UPI0034CEE54A
MSEAELRRQIAALTGAINRHKNNTNNESSAAAHSYAPYYVPEYQNQRGRGRGGASYSRYRAPRAPTHRNRTLVLNTSTPPAQQGGVDGTSGSGTSMPTDVDGTTPQPPIQFFVKKRDRHMQLINTSVYPEIAQARAKAIEQTRLAKKQLRKKSTIAEKLRKDEARRARSSVGTQEFVEIDGVKYKVGKGGSKLTRFTTSDTGIMTQVGGEDIAAPRKAIVSGITFLRSKNGNLYRKGAIQSKRRERKMLDIPCKFFTMTGQCARGLSCPYTHSPTHVRICPLFLQGKCKNLACDLSHTATPNNSPLCVHFQRGYCSNANCKYSHVRPPPDAKICKTFATTGYCDKGAECKERHVFECPEFEATGKCSKAELGKCKLQHVFRAGAGRHVIDGTEDESSVFVDDVQPTDHIVIDNDVLSELKEHLKQDEQGVEEGDDEMSDDEDDHMMDDADEDEEHVEFDSDMFEEDSDGDNFDGDHEYIKF